MYHVDITLITIIHTGDGMLNTAHSGYHNRDLSGIQFSTRDQDNDLKPSANCVDKYKGGWWFNWCHIAFLNGPWSPGNWVYPWYPTITSGSDVKEATMMIKAY
jgi:hypothetical protein